MHFLKKQITNNRIICTQSGFQTMVLKEDVTARSSYLTSHIFCVKMQFAILSEHLRLYWPIMVSGGFWDVMEPACRWLVCGLATVAFSLIQSNLHYYNGHLSTIAFFFSPSRQFMHWLLFKPLYNGYLSTMVMATKPCPQLLQWPLDNSQCFYRDWWVS